MYSLGKYVFFSSFDMLFSKAKTNFLDWLELIKNKSPRTIEQYKRHLDAFEAYFWSHKKMDIVV